MLATTDLWFRYQDEPVLKGLTLDFSRHAVTGLVGANGCGKSTLFMNLSGLLRPQHTTEHVAGGDRAPVARHRLATSRERAFTPPILDKMLRFAANSLHEEAKFKIITQLVPLFTGLSNRSDIGVAAISPRATTATLRTTCRNRSARHPTASGFRCH